jgi:hypothetical protein
MFDDDIEYIDHLSADEKLQVWGYGEWVEEADEATFEISGYKCWIHREISCTGGHLYGYVCIPDSHPWHNLQTEEIPCLVHGGLALSWLQQDEFWIGFSCSRATDIIPYRYNLFKKERRPSFSISKLRNVNITYKNFEFMMSELKGLVHLNANAIKPFLSAPIQSVPFPSFPFLSPAIYRFINETVAIHSFPLHSNPLRCVPIQAFAFHSPAVLAALMYSIACLSYAIASAPMQSNPFNSYPFRSVMFIITV